MTGSAATRRWTGPPPRPARSWTRAAPDPSPSARWARAAPIWTATAACAAGLTDRELARLNSPIGLDLGARTPEGTALSIAAEIVAVRRGGSGAPLTGSHTPTHHDSGGRPLTPVA